MQAARAVLLVALVARPLAAVLLSAEGEALAAAEHRLGARVGRVLGILDDLLDTALFPPLLRPEAALSRLSSEAERLQGDGDDLGALLMRDFARQPQLPRLFKPWRQDSLDDTFGLPYYMDMQPTVEGVEEGDPWTAAEGSEASGPSEQIEVKTDGQGQVVTSIVHCQDGSCKKTTKARQVQKGAGGESMPAAVGGVVRELADEMKQIFGSSGFDGLRNIVGRVLNKTASTPPAVQDTTTKKNSTSADGLPQGLSRALTNMFGAAMKGRTIADVFGNFSKRMGGGDAHMLNDMLGDALGERLAGQVVTSSAETKVENGKLIRTLQRCHDGHCVKETHEEDVPEVQTSGRMQPI